MRRIRKLCAIGLAVVLGLGAAAVQAAEIEDLSESAESVIEETNRELLEERQGEKDELWVNGKNITKERNGTIQCGGGTAVYDGNTNTLTLNNAEISRQYTGRAITRNGSKRELNIVLEGQSRIDDQGAGYDEEIFRGIDCPYSSLSISGPGELQIVTGTAYNGTGEYKDSVGIYVVGNITVDDAALICTNSSENPEVPYSRGIDARGTIKSQRANLTINGFKAGLYTHSTMDENHMVQTMFHAESTLAGSNSIHAANPLLVSDQSELKLKSVGPSIMCYGNLYITDSKAEAGSTGDSGIYVSQNMTIEGQSLITAKGRYSGLNADGTITFEDGEVHAESTEDMGIWSKDRLIINGGTVHAKGAAGWAALGVRAESAGAGEPTEKIAVAAGLREIQGGKVSVSDWYTTNTGKTYSWTSFIPRGTGRLETNRSNALNEVTIMKYTPEPEIPVYTVNFACNGGTNIYPMAVAMGGTIYRPEDPQRAGYTFGGWFADEGLTKPWDFSKDTVIQNMTLFAKWTPEETPTPTPSPVPEKPDTPELNLKKNSTKDIVLSWTPVEGVDGYVLYGYDNGELKDITQRVILSKSRSQISLKYPQGTARSFLLRAYKNIDGKNVYSKKSNKIVTATRPEAAVIQSAVPGKNSVRVQLKGVPSGATGYAYCVSRDGKNWTIAAKSQKMPYTMKDIKTGVNYIKVRAYVRDHNGKSVYAGWSQTLKVKVS